MQDTTDFSAPNPIAMVLCGNPQRHAALEALARTCQCNVVEHKFGSGDEIYSEDLDFLMSDLRSESDHLSQYLSTMARYLEADRTTLLIWTDMNRLDNVYAAFASVQCHFLVDASDVDAVPILFGISGQGKMNKVHDKSRDVAFNALHRISDELAGFARTLARIAEQDAGVGSVVTDKPVSFRPAPAGAFQPFAKAGSINRLTLSAPMIREMIKLRRLRDSYFPQDLFADPAWDILLDLMAARMEGQGVSVSSLCIAAAVPPTTALRWITAMTDSGMLRRQNDPTDARRVFIALSDETERMLHEYLSAAQERFAPLV
jgi:DNA-binding transcriptional ArsR family regulator